GGAGGGSGAAAAALGAGRRRARAGGAPERRGRHREIPPGARAARARRASGGDADDLPLVALCPAQCPVPDDREPAAVPAIAAGRAPRDDIGQAGAGAAGLSSAAARRGAPVCRPPGVAASGALPTARLEPAAAATAHPGSVAGVALGGGGAPAAPDGVGRPAL